MRGEAALGTEHNTYTRNPSSNAPGEMRDDGVLRVVMPGPASALWCTLE